MTFNERDMIELGGRVNALWNERPDDVTARIRDIARHAILNDAKRRQKNRRPRLVRNITALGGMLLVALGAGAWTSCDPVPTDVQIGDGTMVTWWGPASHLPEGCHVIATEPGAPALQASSAPAITRGGK